jgi:1-acyl-sn-glycerol-3-phosphate acyltransferase
MRFSSALLAICLPLAESFAPTNPALLGQGFGKVTGLHNSARERGFGVRGGFMAPIPAVDRKPMHLGAAGSSAVPLLESESLPSYTKIGKVNIKGMNANLLVGPLFVLATFGWAAALYPAITLAYLFSKAFDAKRRRAVDWIVHWWAKLTCFTIFYKPKLIGKENLPAADEAVMYIPNHCSYLDIFTLSGFVPRPFKYVSKIEILRIPLIGWAMQAAGHIAIRRTDKRSQLQTFKDTVEALQNGNSVVTFAEGTRSKSGRLQTFKKGPIKMAIKAKKKIVPVSICDLHRWMPDTAVSPLGFPAGVTIKIHPAIDVVGKGEDDIMKECYEAVNSGLPAFQKCDDESNFSSGGSSVSV